MNRQQVLAKWITGGTAGDGYIAAPGSAATITIWDSGDPQGSATASRPGKDKDAGARFKRLIFNLFSSHASGTNGLSFEESSDDGANWDVLVQYTQTAATYEKRYVSVSAPRVRVRYTNSANVLTAWRGTLLADAYERATQ